MDKLKVLIVEDDPLQSADLEEGLLDLGYEVIGIADCEDEVESILSEIRPDIIFMDIELAGDLDGVDLAININQQFPVPIIYLTDCHDDRTVKRASRLNVGIYLSKPILNYQILDINIKQARQQFEMIHGNNSKEEEKDEDIVLNEEITPDFILIRTSTGKKERLDLSEVLYFSANGSYCNTFIKDKPIYTFTKNLSSIQPVLPSNFFRVHRSYIINLHYLKSMEDNELILTDGEKPIPIGSSYLKELRKKVPIF